MDTQMLRMLQDRIEIGRTKVITDALLDRLQLNYKGLKIESSETQVYLMTGLLTETNMSNLTLDLKFYFKNPNIPLENLSNRLDNYQPVNESERLMVKYAKALIDTPGELTAAGLFIWGTPGVGKTHIAVGTTKEFMTRDLDAGYVGGGDYSRLHEAERSLGPGQVWVLDDLNSPFGTEMDVFKKMVLNAHNVGGRLLVTSNTSYQSLMEKGFGVDYENRRRFTDRSKQMFKTLHVRGRSQRTRLPWYKQQKLL